MCLSLAISPSLLEALQNSQEWGFFVTDVLILTRNRSDLNIGSAPHLKPQCLHAKESFDSGFQFIITSSPSLPPFLLFLRLSLFFPSHLTSSFFSLLLCFVVPLLFSPFFLLSSPLLSFFSPLFYPLQVDSVVCLRSTVLHCDQVQHKLSHQYLLHFSLVLSTRREQLLMDRSAG